MSAEQFNHLLDMEAAAGVPNAGGASGAPAAVPAGGTSGPPTITINGGNPATISLGSTYADLGATITGPQADLNLGIHTFVDGIAIDPVVIHTSIAAPHSIDYVVTGNSGLTSTSTRTVIVSAANDNPPPAANDNELATSTATSTGTN